MKVKFSVYFDFRFLCSVVFVLNFTTFCSNNNGLFHYVLLEIFHISNFYFEMFFFKQKAIFLLLHYVHWNTDDIVEDSVLTWSINCNMFVLPLTDFVTRDVTNIQTDRLKMFTERKTDHRCICEVSSSSTRWDKTKFSEI